MRNKIINSLMIFTLVTLFFSCWDIRKIKIGYISNNTDHDIIAADWFKNINDSLLYNDRIYMGYLSSLS
jgi:hypothetical protein